MTALEFTPIVLATAFFAGLIGSLTGLGGGVILTPVLTLFLHVDIHYAMGASLISVIATSSGAAAAYVRDGYSNIRIGMFLEIATTLGALFGATIATHVPAAGLSIIFGLILLESAWQSAFVQHKEVSDTDEVDPLALKLSLPGEYMTSKGPVKYGVRKVKAGFAVMFGAGTLSGLLGIGSGSLKVIAMDQVMRIPFKVSTATSNFMIGVTAAASASVYLNRGYVDPGLVMPVLLGVLAGSMLGARFLPVLPVKSLRRGFAVVVGLMSIEMILSGLHWGF